MKRFALLFIVGVALCNPNGHIVCADIFRWDDGRLVPGTQGITPGPGVQLDHRELPFASLLELDLTGANFNSSNLSFARLTRSTLTGADFSGANVAGARFSQTTSRGFTPSQLYSTASYQNKKLDQIIMFENDLTGWNFRDQDLTRASFWSARLTNTDFTGAHVTEAFFTDTTSRGFTKEQLYSTGSYQQKNLNDITLDQNNLTGWDFSRQDLTSGLFSRSNLTNTNLSDALVELASFSDTTNRGFTKEQLYSTASYKQKRLTFMALTDNDMAGWDFSGQNLTLTHFDESVLRSANFSGANLSNAYFNLSTLTEANFSNAIVNGTAFWEAGLTKEQLYSTASYQQKNLHETGFLSSDLTGWDFGDQDLSGANFSFTTLKNTNFTGAKIDGASFSTTTIQQRAFTKEQLYSTASYQQKNLQGVNLVSNNLGGWDFRGQDLTRALFGASTLLHTDFTGALISGANFWDTTARGFTKEQLYSTASYQQKNLQGITINQNNLAGWDFSGQDLRNSVFDQTILSNSRFPLADLRLVSGFVPQSSTVLRNTIMPNGVINNLRLDASDTLVVRDFSVNVSVNDGFSIAEQAVLEMELGDLLGGAMISVANGIQPQLGGTLRLAFGPQTDFTDVGSTVDLFDWPTALDPANRFDQIEVPTGTQWDFTRLYTTGEVTLQAIPEPATILLLTAALCGLALRAVRRR